MLDLEPLLRLESPALDTACRVALAGLEGALREALARTAPTDSERAVCSEVLLRLQQFLAGAPSGSVRSPAPSPTPGDGGGACTSLADVQRDFAQDAALKKDVGEKDLAEVEQPAGDEGELWRRMHLLLLRARPEAATAWRERLRQTAGDRVRLVPERADLLPGESVEWLVPPLDGPRPVRGVCLHPDGAVDGRLGGGDSAALPLTNAMARTLSIALWYLDEGPPLHHALESVNQFGVIGLRDDQKRRVEQEIRNRLSWLQQAETDGDVPALVRAWIAVDEAIHSLVHKPIAPETAWWRQIQKKARDRVATVRQRVGQTSHLLHPIVPVGSYAEANRYTDPSRDKPAEGPVPAGDVALCLRIYAKLDGVEYRGRVLYRPR